MSSIKKALMASSGGGGTDVDDVFSTDLYTGNGSTKTITNGIDLSGEGGFVWFGRRSTGYAPTLYDTIRGGSKRLQTSSSGGSATDTGLQTFNSDGYSMQNEASVNTNSATYVAWTFRKAPKFFDVVTYTGNGSSNTQNISHNLGCAVGMMVVKATNTAGNWHTWHRGFGDNGYIMLNMANAKSAYSGLTANTAPTSSVFTVSDSNNDGGNTYIAYLFAHNNADGEFGPDGDQDIIKCGSYAGLGTETPPEVSLGFEPQWMLVKNISSGGSSNPWILVDTMRGWGAPSTTMTQPKYLDPSLANAEGTTRRFGPTANGFMVRDYHTAINIAGQTYIYVAIRRGSLFPPKAATDVFAPNFYGTSGYVGYLGAPADMHMLGYRSGNSQNAIVSSRMIQGNKALVTSSTAAEITSNSSWDNMLGVTPVGSTLSTLISWTWKRAPSFCDVVAYTGNGTAGRTVSHNLGVAPEMIWVKKRASQANWAVYHSGANGGTTPENYHFFLNNANAEATDNNYYWYQTAPTATVFSLGISANTNQNNVTYIAYLFASLPGISKLGSYTGNGTSQTIDCGFTSGARFVLVKCATLGYDWQVFDTERGIVSGNDPKLTLNTTQAEQTNAGFINPSSSGFAVTSSNSMNANGETFLFYAIA
tara:strand:- start:3 stop:1943 length:1941 start_codon:yes stop_codon:yes gene_type:complete